MYEQINRNIGAVLGAVSQAHVDQYDWLIANREQGTDNNYRRRYRAFWQLNPARLSQAYLEAYFDILASAYHSPPTLRDLAERLFNVPADTHGTNKLQFSFATKLLHMVDRRLPIYDSMVAAFYNFTAPPPARAFDERIATLCAFHAFLVAEYARVLQEGLLAGAIAQFRALRGGVNFTDEKVIDSLVWAYQSERRRGIANQAL